MPFCVVLTLKLPSSDCSDVALYVVASKWLRNKNVLAWPNEKRMKPADINTQIQSGTFAMTPADDWTDFACTIKKRFATYKAASEYVEDNLDATTDSDNAAIGELQSRQQAIKNRMPVKRSKQNILHLCLLLNVNCSN